MCFCPDPVWGMGMTNPPCRCGPGRMRRSARIIRVTSPWRSEIPSDTSTDEERRVQTSGHARSNPRRSAPECPRRVRTEDEGHLGEADQRQPAGFAKLPRCTRHRGAEKTSGAQTYLHGRRNRHQESVQEVQCRPRPRATHGEQQAGGHLNRDDRCHKQDCYPIGPAERAGAEQMCPKGPDSEEGVADSGNANERGQCVNGKQWWHRCRGCSTIVHAVGAGFLCAHLGAGERPAEIWPLSPVRERQVVQVMRETTSRLLAAVRGSAASSRSRGTRR